MKRLMLLISLSLISLTAHSGPFGLEMGMSLDELGKKIELKPHGNEKQAFVYNAVSVPNPHPDFNRYILSVSPEHGLCSIAAVSNPIKINNGNGIDSKFSEIEKELSTKYGPPQSRDSLVRSSRSYTAQDWPFSMQDWISGVQNKEQAFKSRWFDKNLEKFNLTSIQLNAERLSGGRFLIELIYYAKNPDTCKMQPVPQESVR